MRYLFCGLIIMTAFAFTSDKPAYTLFDGSGNSVTYSQMIDKLKNADIVLYGELHNNPIAHWMELQITKSLYDAKKENLILGAEMFESDNQLIMDEYLSGKIKKSTFEAEMRLWPNYKTDYRPLVEFAKDKQLKFIADNIPRRYSSIVAKDGFEGLKDISSEAKKFIAPLPINYDKELDCYKKMTEMDDMPAHVTENLPKAQAIKDATMTYFILKNYKKGKLFLHYNGSYHSDNHQSIVWYLLTQKPKLSVMTISTVEQENISVLDSANVNIADFVVSVPDDMTPTY